MFLAGKYNWQTVDAEWETPVIGEVDQSGPAIAPSSTIDVRDPEFRDLVLGHFNEPILSGLSVARVVGYGEDPMDCYIIVRRPSPYNDTAWLTGVGGYVFLDRLKQQNYVRSTEGEDWDDLVQLSKQLSLHGAPEADEPTVEVEASPIVSQGDEKKPQLDRQMALAGRVLAEEAEVLRLLAPSDGGHAVAPPDCGCFRCAREQRAAGIPWDGRIRYACELCGNKRCPHHTDHRLVCTRSNEPGQPGSDYQ